MLALLPRYSPAGSWAGGTVWLLDVPWGVDFEEALRLTARSRATQAVVIWHLPDVPESLTGSLVQS